MIKQRRIKKSAIIIPCIIIIAIISVIIGINTYKKVNSNSYKLSKIGYNDKEAKIVLKLNDKQIKKILDMKYNKVIPKFIKQKYFIFNNLKRYLKYYNKNQVVPKNKIVALVNVNADYKHYKKIKQTETKLQNLMLVNKYNYLPKEFVFKDLEDVSVNYSYGSQKMRKEAYEQFIKLFNDAKKDNVTVIVNSSYRDYNYQKDLWDNYADRNGDEWADSYAARAGYSEHQTGLAIDVTTYGVKEQEDFEKTDAYKWMVDNSYKYGFILRYPKGKEDLTGYAYESWHYRYLGTKIATKVYKSGLTYDEYFAYYMK